MNILHVTDFHFNKRWFNWLLENAPAHDLLVMSGNLLNLSDNAPQLTQIDWVSNWISNYPRPICVCSGNHDLEWDAKNRLWTPAYWLRRLASPKVWTDGQSEMLDGLSLLAISRTTHPKGGAADVWVVHSPPAGTLVGTRSNGYDAGDPDLVNPVRRYAPRVVLSGNAYRPLHWCELKDSTLYLNPGRTPDAPFPNHIFLQTDDLSGELVTAKTHERLKTSESARARMRTEDGCLVSSAV